MAATGSRLAAAAIAISCVALAPTACGGSDEETTAPAADLGFTKGLSGEEREAAATAEAYVAATAAGDGGAICELTSTDEGALEQCQADLSESFSPAEQPRFTVESVRVKGDRATVILSADEPENARDTLFRLTRIDDEWKVLVVGFR